MWILRWVFIAIVLLVILGISLQNTQEVTVAILNWQSEAIPIYIVIYIAFAAGMAMFFLVATYHHIRYRAELRRYRLEIKELEEELDRLRMVSLEDDFSEDDDKHSGSEQTGSIVKSTEE